MPACRGAAPWGAAAPWPTWSPGRRASGAACWAWGGGRVVRRPHAGPALDRGVPNAHGDALVAQRVGARSQLARRCQPDTDAHPRAGVAAIEDVVLTLGASGEPAPPP